MRSSVVAIVALLALSCGTDGEPAAWIEVTDEAVQTFYQNGVPHTDSSGRAMTAYEAGRSFFPRGVYYPELCRAQGWFAWEAFAGGWPDWDGSYQLRISLAGVLGTQRTVVHDERYTGTQALPGQLPADEPLPWQVYPNPWQAYPAGPLAEGTVTVACQADDVDDPNVMSTLAEARFNVALPFRRNHPQPFLNLRERADVDGLLLAVDGREGGGFAEEIFQDYSADTGVFAWQLDDEPLLKAAVGNGDSACDPERLRAALDRLRRVFDDHKDRTEQVLFHVEGAPRYFIENEGCDPGDLWEASVRIGDAANHDNYVDPRAASIGDIATSMSRQTRAIGEAKPSWFTTRAFWRPDEGYPSPARLRASVYTALVHGATGIWYFIWDSFMTRFTSEELGLIGVRPAIPEAYNETFGVSASPEVRAQGEALWRAIAALDGELAHLEPALLSPTAGDGAYRVFVRDPASEVRTLLKRARGGEYVLLAVNMNSTPTDVRFEFGDELASAGTLFEVTSSLGQETAVLIDRFGGIDDAESSPVHVYRLRFADGFAP